MQFILGIIVGIVLTIVAFIGGKKFNKAIEKYEVELEDTQRPWRAPRMATIIKKESPLDRILKKE